MKKHSVEDMEGKPHVESPAGGPEVEAAETSEELGTQVPPEAHPRTRSTKRKEPKPDQPINPKRTRGSETGRS